MQKGISDRSPGLGLCVIILMNGKKGHKLVVRISDRKDRLYVQRGVRSQDMVRWKENRRGLWP